MKRVVGLVFLVVGLAACSGSGASPTPGATAADTPTHTGPVSTVAINAGGPTSGDFTTDRFFAAGAPYRANATTIDMSQVTDGTPADVFLTERYGVMSYSIPDRVGLQTVTLYFAETFVKGEGLRTFGVTINGTPVLSDFDIYKAAGGSARAIARTFEAQADSDGKVVIGFVKGVENPKISAIKVVGGGSTATPPPPTPTPTPAAAPTDSADAKPSAGCGKARTLQNGTITIDSNGPRTYILQAPDTYDKKHPYRLVVAYHWGGGSAEQVVEDSGTGRRFYGLWEQAHDTTIFVAPQGRGSGEDAGWANIGGEDVALTDKILAQVEAALCIDTNRVFANGFSYGGAMSYSVACSRPDVFRAVAIYAGGQFSGCDGGTKPVAMFIAHGVSDSVVSIYQGQSLRDHFVTVNGLTLQVAPEPEPGSGTHICTKYPGGSPQFPIEWCAFDGDHTSSPLDASQSSSWIPAEVWAFFSQF